MILSPLQFLDNTTTVGCVKGCRTFKCTGDTFIVFFWLRAPPTATKLLYFNNNNNNRLHLDIGFYKVADKGVQK